MCCFCSHNMVSTHIRGITDGWGVPSSQLQHLETIVICEIWVSRPHLCHEICWTVKTIVYAMRRMKNNNVAQSSCPSFGEFRTSVDITSQAHAVQCFGSSKFIYTDQILTTHAGTLILPRGKIFAMQIQTSCQKNSKRLVSRIPGSCDRFFPPPPQSLCLFFFILCGIRGNWLLKVTTEVSLRLCMYMCSSPLQT